MDVPEPFTYYCPVTEMSTMWDKLTKELGVPKMVFSIIGDSEYFVPKPWKKFVFQTALINSAQNAGKDSWIVYRGYNVGISDIVRDAYVEYIRGEYYDYNGKMKKDRQSPIKLIKLYNEIDEHFQQQDNSNTKIDRLIHDEHIDKPKEEFYRFLVEFEKHMSKQFTAFFNWKDHEKSIFSMRIPVIVVMAEGDLDTVQHVVDAINNKLPVLIVKGSGKAADLIVRKLESEDDVEKLAPVLFGLSFDEIKWTKLKEKLETIAQEETRYLLNIFDVENDDPLMMSKIVGDAIVRCWAINGKSGEDIDGPVSTLSREKTSIQRRKPVAYTATRDTHMHNEAYVREFDKNERPHVLSTTFTSPSSLPLFFYFGYQLLQEKKEKNLLRSEQGKILLLEALKSNRCDYVQVLIDQGVSFDEKYFGNLYRTTVKCTDCEYDKECLHMQWILRQSNSSASYKLLFDKNHEDDGQHIRQSAKVICTSLLGYKASTKLTELEKLLSMTNKWKNQCNERTEIISDLLLWSLYADRKDLSEILWLKSEDHLISALACSVLLKKLAKKAKNVKEEIFSQSLQEHAKLFSDRCQRLLTDMYEDNSKAAMKIVDSETKIWGIRTTPLVFAHENYELDFIAHTCSQRRINRIWYNKQAPDFKPFLKSIFKKPNKFLMAPFTKFLINYLLFMLMLIAFSAFVMTSIDDHYYRRPIARVWEYYIYIWAGGDLFEEIKSGVGIFTTKGRSHRGYWVRTKRYLNDFWNFIDLLSYVLLILGLFTRHLIEPEPFTIARRLFSMSLLVMFLRYLQIFLMNRRLGPTLIMIKEMLKDLLYFLLIAILAIIGVGIYYHANLYPNQINLVGPGTWDSWHIWKVFYYPYWQLYGETFSEFLEVKEESNCTSDPAIYEKDPYVDRCPEKDPTVPMVSAGYMLISNLLLVNLVIAMFSYTFDKVMTNSEKLWRFERYTVITDYEEKIPSPFNILIRPVLFCWHSCVYCKNKVSSISEKKTDLRIKKLRKKYFHRRHIQKVTAIRGSMTSLTML